MPWKSLGCRNSTGLSWAPIFGSPSPNTRAGVAVFVESARADADADATTDVGLFAQLKANVTMFDY